MKAALQVEISFEQVLSLVMQLPKNQKIILSKELEKEGIDSKLQMLLQKFKAPDLDTDLLNEEVEKVRQSLHDKKH
jgi:hypothetical protein